MINAETRNYAKECNNFLFRKSWVDVFRALTNEQAGTLIKSVCNFITGVDEPPEDPVVNVAYELTTAKLNDSCKRHLNNLCQKRILR